MSGMELRATVHSAGFRTSKELHAAMKGGLLSAQAERSVGMLLEEIQRKDETISAQRKRIDALTGTVSFYRKTHHRAQEYTAWDAMLLGVIVGSMLTAALFGVIQTVIDVRNIMALLIGVYMFGAGQGYFCGQASMKSHRQPGRVEQWINKRKEAEEEDE